MRLVEEQKRAEEEKAKQEADRAAKKEKERLKKEKLKAEGKLLTKKQKEEKKLQERRREQLLQGNVSIPGLQQEPPARPSKVVYTKKNLPRPRISLKINLWHQASLKMTSQHRRKKIMQMMTRRN